MSARPYVVPAKLAYAVDAAGQVHTHSICGYLFETIDGIDCKCLLAFCGLKIFEAEANALASMCIAAGVKGNLHCATCGNVEGGMMELARRKLQEQGK